MDVKINYQKQLDKQIKEWSEFGRIPTLLLHSCCAPCSSYCLEYLSAYADITIFYYNPNITEETEYRLRVSEQQRLIGDMKLPRKVGFIEGRYEPDRFFDMAGGLEKAPEGGARCFRCYELRLSETARTAVEAGFDYFSTTLSISPLKNAQILNEIGRKYSDIYNIGYLFSDFKKNNGYKRSVELSHEYKLYRQNYCGCVYSKKEQERN